jgi:hypothetical protein
MEQPRLPDWAQPISHGVAVPSVSAAQRRVSFRVTTLPPAAHLHRVLVSSPGTPAALALVVLQYRTTSGLVDVYEETAQLTPAQFRRLIQWWVSRNGKPCTVGTASSAMLDHKYPAFISTSSDKRRSAIMWSEAGVQYSIQGPAITKQICIRLGNELA